MPEQPLRIFVAMPGTDMGPNASYKEPESVKENLLDPVVGRLEARIGRNVQLVIEKDKRVPGGIHDSMFSEARDAEVYIADLTGANPNVYLELGVRWALRDYVTVVICQSVEDLKFNVTASRAITYGPKNLIKAADDIASAILDGLEARKSDSLVRANSSYVQALQRNSKHSTTASNDSNRSAARSSFGSPEPRMILSDVFSFTGAPSMSTPAPSQCSLSSG